MNDMQCLEGSRTLRWFRHLLAEMQIPRQLLEVVQIASTRRGFVFTYIERLMSTVKKDGGQSHDKRFRIVVSVLREGTLAGRRSLDENHAQDACPGHESRLAHTSST